jgi:homoserine kinase
LALGFYLDVELETTDGSISVESTGEGGDELPTDESNLIAQMVLRAGGEAARSGFHLRVHNEIPLTRGFGSSAAAIVAGLALGLWLETGEIDRDELLRLSTEIEGHPDNVSATIFGGLTVSAVVDEEVISHSLRLPAAVGVVGIIPEREISTIDARNALPDRYDRADVVFNLQRLGLLLSSLSKGDLSAIGAGVQDKLHQDYRIGILPEMAAVIERVSALDGALGAFVSGAGPAVAVLVQDDGELVGRAGVKAFTERDIDARFKLLDVDYEGIQLDHSE